MDIHDKLERAQDELWCMEDALSALQDVQGMEHVRQIIKDAMVVKGFEVEQLHNIIEARDNKERSELVTDYIRSVI